MQELLCGLDEAGRGPLAGPVIASAVILPPDFPTEILNDSKKLSEKRRIYAASVIKEKAFLGIGEASHTEIDKINILQASMLAMSRAFDDMMQKFAEKIDFYNISISCIADGTTLPPIKNAIVRCEPKADGKYPCVMAASIIAKTYRDALMQELDALYPQYGYAKHKGYPTKAHREICHKIGPSPIQRLTFSY